MITTNREQEHSSVAFDGIRVSLIAAALVASCGAVYPSSAASQNDGAALFQKHCSVCHTTALQVGPTHDILSVIRTPPAGMPAYDEEKLSDRDVRAIAEYLHAAVPAEPATVGTEPAAPAPTTPSERGSSAREKRQKMKGFGTTDD